MAYLVGVSGLAGAGKTTAVKHLANVADGVVIYLGEAVLQEVRQRGLEETRENERLIRLELRQLEGPDALVKRCADRVRDSLNDKVPVFIDAIFHRAEFECLKSYCPEVSAFLVGI